MKEKPHDPHFDPIRPPPGAPDQLGVAREPPRAWIDPAANSDEDIANGKLTISFSVPVIRPADPTAWEKVVPLDFPLLVDGAALTEIHIRRPTGADIAELMEESSDEETLPARLYARICGVHPAVFGALWPDDSERVAEAARPFLPRAILDIEAAQRAESASG
ncbi:phage tail assembly protein [Bosea sp. MMO-172]|uniref:phage tail assembly protein n=1 Tax=Bosea sp. MMO-172 TaxID=3127885 RepID=UPI003015BE3C